MEIDEAIRIATLWQAGKMIGGDDLEVNAALLAEIERLRSCARSVEEALERAAVVCEDQWPCAVYDPEKNSEQRAFQQCADAVRALKAQP